MSRILNWCQALERLVDPATRRLAEEMTQAGHSVSARTVENGIVCYFLNDGNSY